MKKILFLFFAAALLMGGCAATNTVVKPEKNELDAKAAIEQAKKDIEEAKQAGAEKYAKDLLDAAVSKLTIAEESFGKKDFDVAMGFAKKASDDAKAATMKSKAASEIENAEKLIAQAKDMKAGDYAPDAMKSAEESLALAKTNFEAKDFAKAYEYAKKASEFATEAIKTAELYKKANDAIEQAKTDIADAKAAGAEKLAAELYKSAIENLAKAVSALSTKDYLNAITYANKASDDAKAAKAACAAKPKNIKVKKGDNLWKLSKKPENYGDPFMWPLIYKANHDKITNPDLIYPDQEFDVPSSVSDADRNEAIEKAKKTPYKGK